MLFATCNPTQAPRPRHQKPYKVAKGLVRRVIKPERAISRISLKCYGSTRVKELIFQSPVTNTPTKSDRRQE